MRAAAAALLCALLVGAVAAAGAVSVPLSQRVMHLPALKAHARGMSTRTLAAEHRASAARLGLPENFDGREAFGACIHPVLDQGDCGSCWAFAASETLSDRTCIYSNGSVNVVLSPQNLLSCEKLNLGCTMGSLPEWAWKFLTEKGITTLGCVPYVNGDGGRVPACQHACDDGSRPTMYYAANYTHVGDFFDASKHIEAIMAAVVEGPVDATFNVYADFDAYDGGVYRHRSGGYEGLHSVKVIGYGIDAASNEPYWLVQNSWSADWGDHGFFKILKGADECSFERLMYTGFPRF